MVHPPAMERAISEGGPSSVGEGPEGLRGAWGASLQGERVLLRPIHPQDYPALFEIETGPFLGTTWRQRGATPSYERFVASLFEGVLAQYIVVSRRTSTPRGYVTLYNANLGAGWAYVAAAKFDHEDRSGEILLGAALLIDYAFEGWPIHKLYAEVSGHNIGGFQSMIGRVFVEEARLTEHEYWGGCRWDSHILAVSRERWSRWRRVVIGHVKGERFRQSGDQALSSREWFGATSAE